MKIFKQSGSIKILSKMKAKKSTQTNRETKQDHASDE
jgi:hypothetical protein